MKYILGGREKDLEGRFVRLKSDVEREQNGSDEGAADKGAKWIHPLRKAEEVTAVLAAPLLSRRKAQRD